MAVSTSRAWTFNQLTGQSPMAEEDIENTVFTVRSGKYEFHIMPFGLTNAVATFCHIIDKIFAE